MCASVMLHVQVLYISHFIDWGGRGIPNFMLSSPAYWKEEREGGFSTGKLCPLIF